MRRTRGCWIGSLVLLLASSAGSGTEAAPFAVDEIAPGVFVHLGRQLPLDAPGHDDIANTGFVIGSRCVAVIDSGGSTRIGRALRAAIRARTQRPVCYVINTHVHVDHVLGNAAFKSEHARYVGHANLGAALARSRDLFLRDYAGDFDAPASADQVIAPDLGVKDTLELDLGGRQLLLEAWPNAHTDCDLSVLDAASRTLFAGDLLFRARMPVVDASAVGWIAAIDALVQVPAMRVVPGHGPVAAELKSAFAPERRYLAALVAGVRAAIANGESLGDAAKRVAPDDKAEWLLAETAHAHNVARVYQELEWE